MADETMLMIGTRKGLWIGTVRRARAREWTIEGPHFEMKEIYSCLVDTRGDRPRLLVGASLELDRARRCSAPTTSAGPGRSRRRDRLPRRTRTPRVERVWQLVPGPERRGGLRRHRAGAPCSGPPTAARPSDLERALWDHPHRTEWGAGFGGQAFHTILPHPTDSASVTVALSTGGVYQTHDGGASWAPRNHGHPGGVPARGPAVPRVRPVRAQGGPPPVQPASGCSRRTTAASTAPTTRAALGVDRRRAAVRLRLPDRGAPARARHRLRVPARRRRRALPARGHARASGAPATPARRWEPLGEGLPETFYVGVMRDAMSADNHDPAGLYFGGRNGSRLGLGRRRRDLAPGRRPTCPT